MNHPCIVHLRHQRSNGVRDEKRSRIDDGRNAVLRSEFIFRFRGCGGGG
eukprot:CAMPEP_0196219794 /NCGR_PEP_ID=MMETSP0912-20130531/39488_1 /TAXON_ID=49265 /ORGANISM="Thalassiosira rotula, Strain GSO102" /LENGTH=48 /DNA_ID= /DNA_START= /DNA_END= /DNA_ORIENTATION=